MCVCDSPWGDPMWLTGRKIPALADFPLSFSHLGVVLHGLLTDLTVTFLFLS